MNSEQKRKLKQRCHDLKPVIWIGQKGLTENVLSEINQALDDHELIKIKVAAGDKTEKTNISQAICDEMKAEFIQGIGNMYSFLPGKSKQIASSTYFPFLSNITDTLVY